jgi:hypothetical protein
VGNAPKIRDSAFGGMPVDYKLYYNAGTSGWEDHLKETLRDYSKHFCLWEGGEESKIINPDVQEPAVILPEGEPLPALPKIEIPDSLKNGQEEITPTEPKPTDPVPTEPPVTVPPTSVPPTTVPPTTTIPPETTMPSEPTVPATTVPVTDPTEPPTQAPTTRPGGTEAPTTTPGTEQPQPGGEEDLRAILPSILIAGALILLGGGAAGWFFVLRKRK